MDQVNVVSIDRALQAVEAWRAEQDRKHSAEVAEVDQEMESLKRAVENLQQQLTTLVRFREDLVGKRGQLDDELAGRRHATIFKALDEQRAALEVRAAEVLAHSGPNKEKLEQMLTTDPQIAGVYAEYKQFKATVEPTLAVLPETYRNVVMAHHDGIKAKVDQYVKSKASSAREPLDVPVLPVNVVYAIDGEEGAPEFLMVIVPVPGACHTEWMEREEDLNTHLAARVAQAVYECARKHGLRGAQANIGDHRGLLALEADVHGVRPQFSAELGTHLNAILCSVPELSEARVRATSSRLTVDDLVPGTDGADDETVVVGGEAHAP